MMLWVTDLDGTLLRSDASLSDYASRSLNELIHGGARITYCTARSPDKARELLGRVPFRLPAIVLDGSMLVDVVSGDVLHAESLDPSTATQLIELGHHCGISPFVLGRESGRDVFFHHEPENAGQQQFLENRRDDPRLRHMSELRPAQVTLTVSFVGSEQALLRVRGVVQSELGVGVEMKLLDDLYCPGFSNLSVFDSGVDKGRMLERLCLVTETPARQVTYFGDNLNDLGAFAAAGRSVAVANAHPELLKAADEVIASNDSDGVIHYLLEHVSRGTE